MRSPVLPSFRSSLNNNIPWQNKNNCQDSSNKESGYYFNSQIYDMINNVIYVLSGCV